MKEQFEILKGWENCLPDFWDVSISEYSICMHGWFSTALLNKYLSLGFVFETKTTGEYTHLKAEKDNINIILTIN